MSVRQKDGSEGGATFKVRIQPFDQIRLIPRCPRIDDDSRFRTRDDDTGRIVVNSRESLKSHGTKTMEAFTNQDDDGAAAPYGGA